MANSGLKVVVEPQASSPADAAMTRYQHAAAEALQTLERSYSAGSGADASSPLAHAQAQIDALRVCFQYRLFMIYTFR